MMTEHNCELLRFVRFEDHMTHKTIAFCERSTREGTTWHWWVLCQGN